MCAVTASGTSFPSYVMYRATHLYDTCCNGRRVGAFYNRAKSGWFESHWSSPVFGPMKRIWRQKVELWKLNNYRRSKTLPTIDIPQQ